MFDIRGLIEAYAEENKDSVINERVKDWTEELTERFKAEATLPQFAALRKAVFEKLNNDLDFDVFKTEVQRRYNDILQSGMSGFDYMIRLKRAEFLSHFTTAEAYDFTKAALSMQYKYKDFEKEILSEMAFYAYSKANHIDSKENVVDPIAIYSDDYAEIRKVKQLTGGTNAGQLYLKRLNSFLYHDLCPEPEKDVSPVSEKANSLIVSAGEAYKDKSEKTDIEKPEPVHRPAKQVRRVNRTNKGADYGR